MKDKDWPKQRGGMTGLKSCSRALSWEAEEGLPVVEKGGCLLALASLPYTAQPETAMADDTTARRQVAVLALLRPFSSRPQSS